MEIIEEAEEAMFHLLHIGNISQKGVLDNRSCLTLVLIRFSPQTQMVPGLIPNPPVKRQITPRRGVTTLPNEQRGLAL